MDIHMLYGVSVRLLILTPFSLPETSVRYLQSNTAISAKRPGISRTIFAVSLVIVAVAAGLGGYFSYGLLHPSPVLTLTGSGSTLVYPLMSAWASNYNSLHSSV